MKQAVLYKIPRMQIWLRGKMIKTQRLSGLLRDKWAERYYPQGELSERCSEQRRTSGFPIEMGFSCLGEGKGEGMMLYHGNRLIYPFLKLGIQQQSNDKGRGVLGVIDCDFLQPTHNKQDFNDTKTFRLLKTKLAQSLKEFWYTRVESAPQARKARPDPRRRAEPDNVWVQCEFPQCLKWRKLPRGTRADDLPDIWYCHMNPDKAQAKLGHNAPVDESHVDIPVEEATKRSKRKYEQDKKNEREAKKLKEQEAREQQRQKEAQLRLERERLEEEKERFAKEQQAQQQQKNAAKRQQEDLARLQQENLTTYRSMGLDDAGANGIPKKPRSARAARGQEPQAAKPKVPATPLLTPLADFAPGRLPNGAGGSSDGAAQARAAPGGSVPPTASASRPAAAKDPRLALSLSLIDESPEAAANAAPPAANGTATLNPVAVPEAPGNPTVGSTAAVPVRAGGADQARGNAAGALAAYVDQFLAKSLPPGTAESSLFNLAGVTTKAGPGGPAPAGPAILGDGLPDGLAWEVAQRLGQRLVLFMQAAHKKQTGNEPPPVDQVHVAPLLGFDVKAFCESAFCESARGAAAQE